MSDERRSKVPDPILDYPEFAATLGMIVSQATYLEAQLAEIFAIVAGTDSERGRKIYWSFPTFNQRQRVMHVLLDTGYQPHKQEINAIMRRAKDFLSFRNSSVHDLWYLREEGGSPVHRIAVNLVRDSKPEAVKVKLKEMRQKVDMGVSLNADLMGLINRIG